MVVDRQSGLRRTFVRRKETRGTKSMEKREGSNRLGEEEACAEEKRARLACEQRSNWHVLPRHQMLFRG